MKQSDWNAEDWLDSMHRALSRRNYELTRTLRQQVWTSTVDFVQKGSYRANGQTINMERNPDMQNETIFYSDEIKISADAPRYEQTTIVVKKEDTLNEAYRMVKNGMNPCVLNMASRSYPGGGVQTGAGAQEENICRRSDYYQSIYQFHNDGEKFGVSRNPQFSYPLDRNFGGIYSPNVTVFRGDEKSGYELMTHPFKTALVAVAAISHPEVVDDRISPDLIELTLNKIRTILRIAYKNGHHNLVLSAFGCGAFCNPPQHMSELFKQALEEDEFKNRFNEIVFAILSVGGSNEKISNYDCFKKTFEN